MESKETKIFELKIVVVAGMGAQEKDLVDVIIRRVEATGSNILIVPYRQAADQEKRATAIGFAEWTQMKGYSGSRYGFWHNQNQSQVASSTDELFDLYIQSQPPKL